MATLLLMGLHNLPLAAPGLVNIADIASSRRAIGWVLGGLLVAINLALFVGSLVFLASGQTFEQFRGSNDVFGAHRPLAVGRRVPAH